MDNKILKIQYNEICKNLAERKLKPAFDKIEQFITENKLVYFLDQWQNLEQTYHYMLQYTLEGTQDPERQKIYRKLIISAYELCDKVYEEVRLKQWFSVDYEKKRSFNTEPDLSKLIDELEDYYLNNELISLVEQNDKNKELESAQQFQQKIYRLFYYFWFKNQLNTADIEFLEKFFESNLISAHYKSLLVSAVFLSLQRYFDVPKFNFLFTLQQHPESEINQRALIALLVGFYNYDERIQFYPEITSRLTLLTESKGFNRNLERIIIQLIRSRETEKIQQKIRDEIIPEMIKISPNLKDKINLDSLMDDSLGEDKNPEWEELFKDSPGLMDKMEEFSKLQMEGADVFMSSFSMLKRFPFFDEIANWFMPFFAPNPAVSPFVNTDEDVNRRFIEAINDAPILCNSDKYSFCFSIQNLPPENREFMAEGMKAEISQFNELQNDDELTEPGTKAGFISNQYIQDLYRFYKLHPRRRDFEDIFSWRFDFHNKQIIGDILKTDEKMFRNIAEYYFSKNYFDEAAEIFQLLLESNKSGELYQKIGFCYQKQGNFEAALEAYKNAELFDVNQKWTLNKIALCYRNLKQPQKALEYYRMAEKLNEKDLSVQLNIGRCLLELEEFEEALKCYFKVEYLAPGNQKVWRPIGWCSFVTGKKKQAEKYFQKLIDDEPSKHDYMNMGHVQWSLGNRKAALDFYKKSITKTNFSEAGFFEVFEEDLHHLISQGIDKDDVPIMLDQLRYFVED